MKMSFFYLHKLETLTMRNVVFNSVNLHTIPISLHQSFTKNCTISHEITNHAVAIGSRLQRLKSVTGKTQKNTFTETFDRI